MFQVLPTVRGSTATTTTEANVIQEETESSTYFPVSDRSETTEETTIDHKEDELLITQFRQEIQRGNHDHAREILVSSNLTAADAALLLDIPKQQVEEILGTPDTKEEPKEINTQPRQRTRQRPVLVKDINLEDYYDTESGSGSGLRVSEPGSSLKLSQLGRRRKRGLK